MNDRMARKIRQYTRRRLRSYHSYICDKPLIERIRFCWHILIRHYLSFEEYTKLSDTNRNYIGCELDKDYYNIMVKRIPG